MPRNRLVLILSLAGAVLLAGLALVAVLVMAP
jgi:hypothetical protein